MVISQGLAGPVGLFVKFSQLQEYGVDRVFLLENGNVDSSLRNVVFLAYAEKIRQVRAVAGMSNVHPILNSLFPELAVNCAALLSTRLLG